MEITIVGAGEVGQSIAATLAKTHEVTIIDTDEEIVEELVYLYDILAICGDGRDIETLHKASVESADLVIACTNDDDVNIVICGAVAAVSSAFTVARVRQQILFETWKEETAVFGVDFLACTNLLTARAMLRIAGLSSAQDADTFAGDLVRMVELEIEPGSPIIDDTILDINQYDSLTFAGLFRNDEMIIPSDETVIRPEDRLVVIGSPVSVAAFANDITTCPRESDDNIVIVGASETGYQIASEFEPHGYQVRLIEPDPERARYAAETLPETTVLNGDPTDLEFLKREHVGEADIVVSALTDELNLLVSIVARSLGVDETVAIVEQQEYTELFETAGIDVTVNPREETAEEIIRFTRLVPTEKIVMLEHDRAEVIEIEIAQESGLVGRRIRDAIANFPNGVVVGAITRAGEIIMPQDGTVIKTGDNLVLFVDSNELDEVIELI